MGRAKHDAYLRPRRGTRPTGSPANRLGRLYPGAETGLTTCNATPP